MSIMSSTTETAAKPTAAPKLKPRKNAAVKIDRARSVPITLPADPIVSMVSRGKSATALKKETLKKRKRDAASDGCDEDASARGSTKIKTRKRQAEVTPSASDSEIQDSVQDSQSEGRTEADSEGQLYVNASEGNEKVELEVDAESEAEITDPVEKEEVEEEDAPVEGSIEKDSSEAGAEEEEPGHTQSKREEVKEVESEEVESEEVEAGNGEQVEASGDARGVGETGHGNTDRKGENKAAKLPTLKQKEFVEGQYVKTRDKSDEGKIKKLYVKGKLREADIEWLFTEKGPWLKGEVAFPASATSQFLRSTETDRIPISNLELWDSTGQVCEAYYLDYHASHHGYKVHHTKSGNVWREQTKQSAPKRKKK